MASCFSRPIDTIFYYPETSVIIGLKVGEVLESAVCFKMQQAANSGGYILINPGYGTRIMPQLPVPTKLPGPTPVFVQPAIAPDIQKINKNAFMAVYLLDITAE